MDYFEYKTKEIGNDYPIIRDSFNYFSGLVETGIELLVNLNIKTNMCVCHERIKKDYTIFDLYNPFNLIIDSSVRDCAEYFKTHLNEKIDNEILNYLKILNNDELQMFFIRMLYPTFYFDEYEYLIEYNKENIYSIIDQVDEYEKIIKKTYISIKNICPLPEIDWLIK